MSKGFITGTNEELIKAYKESRDESYLKELIEANKGLINLLVSPYLISIPNSELEDLTSESYIPMLRAIEDYDPAELTDVRTKYRILINNLMADFSKDIAQGKVKVKNINDFERLVKLDMLLMGEATERVERGGTQELSQDAKDRLDEIAQLMKRLTLEILQR